MKKSPLLILTFLLFVFFSCRKDNTVELPKSSGNFLILELDKEFTIVGGNEITIPDFKVNNNDINTDIIVTSNQWLVTLKNTNDTILYLDQKNNIQPEIFPIEKFKISDDRLFNKITLDDYDTSENTNTNIESLYKQTGNNKIIHAYLNSEKSSKIKILKCSTYQYDTSLDLSIPKVRYFLLMGYEI